MDKSSETRTNWQQGPWQSAASNRVCPINFVDGLATDKNLIPTLFIGYKSKEKISRKTLFRKKFKKKWRKMILHLPFSISQKEEVHLLAYFIDENLDISVEGLNEQHESIKSISGDHTYCLSNNSTPCYACRDKPNHVKVLG